MTLPPLYALRAFEAAARLGSFSKAAAALNVTPGAVSRHIRTLESWFECELFRRNGPRIDITDAGRTLSAQLTEGFLCLERACSAFRSNSFELRLKAPSTLTMRWLLDVLNAFRENNSTPKIEISSVWMDTDAVDFNREPYDCAILQAIKNGLLMLPFSDAVATGDGYYMVWPKNTRRKKNIDLLYHWLKDSVPTLPAQGVTFLKKNHG